LTYYLCTGIERVVGDVVDVYDLGRVAAQNALKVSSAKISGAADGDNS
jgi:hypothetical protein|tara:strand:- start:81 stop:224 length:144 start_codon:yes stop_codon:yes gene_type:complete